MPGPGGLKSKEAIPASRTRAIWRSLQRPHFGSWPCRAWRHVAKYDCGSKGTLLRRSESAVSTLRFHTRALEHLPPRFFRATLEVFRTIPGKDISDADDKPFWASDRPDPGVTLPGILKTPWHCLSAPEEIIVRACILV